MLLMNSHKIRLKINHRIYKKCTQILFQTFFGELQIFLRGTEFNFIHLHGHALNMQIYADFKETLFVFYFGIIKRTFEVKQVKGSK